MKFKINLKSLSVEFPVHEKEAVSKPITNKEIWVFGALLTSISIGAWVFFYNAGLTLSYNDARSHLNIARRVVESLQPGVAQLGSVWLPLFHILELPLIRNDFMWRSGIAGSVVSMAAYILGGIFLAFLAQELEFDLWATLITLAIYAFNPNLLFLQTTPMTEALQLTTSIGAVYFLVKWAKAYNIQYLVFSAFFTMLSTLTRYDGWFLLIFANIAIFLVGFKEKSFKFAKGNVVLYCTLAGFGVLLWFLWNLVIFGDPLYFAYGQFSAEAQQKIVEAQGGLITKDNVMYSTFLYLLTVKDNIGIWLSILTIVGGWLFATYKGIPLRVRVMASLLFVPFIFNILSLIGGHSVIHLPDIAPYTWFNDRYGLMVLPGVALVVGFIGHKKKMAVLLLALIIILQSYIIISTNQIITIQDGVRGASGGFLDDVGQWVNVNVDHGLILIAASSNDGLIFISGKPMGQFITEGVLRDWKPSLEDPTKHADWVVMQKGDLVYAALKNNPQFLKHYKLMYKGNFAHIYKLDMNSKKSLTAADLP